VAVCQHEPALHAHLAAVPATALAALPRLFRALPARLPPTASVTSSAMEALLRHLNFYSSLTKSAHQVSSCVACACVVSCRVSCRAVPCRVRLRILELFPL
jgi:hypothetical protein